MNYAEAIMERADELMANGPGHVVVRRISHIDEVRVLRAAREALTEEEKTGLAQLSFQVIERLDGVRTWVPPATPNQKQGLLGALLSPLAAAAKGLGQAARAQGAHAHPINQTGGPARLPAPAELIDAAEAWAISYIVEGRIEGDTSLLRRSWDDATVEPAT